MADGEATDIALPSALSFEFDGKPARLGVPKVNGHVVPLAWFEVHAEAGGPGPAVTVSLPAHDALKLALEDEALQIKVSSETREALTSLGWTPPGEGDCAARRPMSFEYDGDSPLLEAPVVNGHRLMSVTSFDVRVAPFGEPSEVTVTLTLLPADVLKPLFAGDCDNDNFALSAKLGEKTRSALVSLGWTPPPCAPAGIDAGRGM
jgi:hypothetical protein